MIRFMGTGRYSTAARGKSLQILPVVWCCSAERRLEQRRCKCCAMPTDAGLGQSSGNAESPAAVMPQLREKDDGRGWGVARPWRHLRPPSPCARTRRSDLRDAEGGSRFGGEHSPLHCCERATLAGDRVYSGWRPGTCVTCGSGGRGARAELHCESNSSRVSDTDPNE